MCWKPFGDDDIIECDSYCRRIEVIAIEKKGWLPFVEKVKIRKNVSFVARSGCKYTMQVEKIVNQHLQLSRDNSNYLSSYYYAEEVEKVTRRERTKVADLITKNTTGRDIYFDGCKKIDWKKKKYKNRLNQIFITATTARLVAFTRI